MTITVEEQGTELQAPVDRSAKLQSFRELLQKLLISDDEKKRLWLEIYENAIEDRHNAHTFLVTLMGITKDKSVEHAVHGKSIALYMDKMSKANDQLLRLAELIADAQNNVDRIDPDKMFEMIKNGR